MSYRVNSNLLYSCLFSVINCYERVWLTINIINF